MSAAHLPAVPGPEPDDEASPGEWQSATPVVHAITDYPEPLDGYQVENPPDDEQSMVDEDLDDADREEEDEPEDAEENRGWMPDLKPYYDVTPLAELGPLAVEVGKAAGPPLLRLLLRALRAFVEILVEGLVVFARGSGVLLLLLRGWLAGEFGKHGSRGARCAGTGFAAYGIFKSLQQYPLAPYVALGALVVATVLVAIGQITVPESKEAKKNAGGKKGTPAKNSKAGPVEIDEVSKEGVPATPRKGLLNRVRGKAKTPAEEAVADPEETTVEDAEDGSEKSAEERSGEAREETEEAPAGPSPEDVIRAFHHLFAGGSGVLHTALAKHLGLADTRAVKRVLDEAGIPYRDGVRTPAGNGPGVHCDNVPPLTPALEGTQGVGVGAGQPANANANNTAISPEEGLSAYRTEWMPEELERGFRSIPDPDRGPAANRIERLQS